MDKLPDVYVDFRTQVIVLDFDDGRVEQFSREQAVALLNALVRGLEELAIVRHAL